MRAQLFGLVVLGLVAGVGSASAQIVGEGLAIDGDTLDVAGLRVRLFGVDAPEIGQACADATGTEWDCGAAAKARLTALLSHGDVNCEAIERDGHGRVVARCAAGDVDLNERMVAEGLAWAYTDFTTAYAQTEDEAREAGLGVWGGSAQTAWDWRRAGEWRAASGEAAPEGCSIKGNVSATGERIYHTPGSRWYDRIRIDSARGQRWFCDAAEAEAAGWRPVAGNR